MSTNRNVCAAGDPALPRAPVGRVLAGAAPRAGRAGDGGARRHGARVGRAHQGQRAHARRTHRHHRLARLPGRRTTGTYRSASGTVLFHVFHLCVLIQSSLSALYARF